VKLTDKQILVISLIVSIGNGLLQLHESNATNPESGKKPKPSDLESDSTFEPVSVGNGVLEKY